MELIQRQALGSVSVRSRDYGLRADMAPCKAAVLRSQSEPGGGSVPGVGLEQLCHALRHTCCPLITAVAIGRQCSHLFPVPGNRGDS
ncbi:hypothetical protein AAFF_G00113190 [Aldrovandia affinis]|uniref:Uncharacterized protein n=1 Tax=Aldrovandia affinis TaxID=143900 RepID=A0AAD7WAW6_9TELE|nr:hypothetical protein AAFF_G00113190 [Aldrovandia affinis]